MDFASWLRGLHPDASPTTPLENTILPPHPRSVPHWQAPGEGCVDKILEEAGGNCAVIYDPATARGVAVMAWTPKPYPTPALPRLGGPAA
jgi:hypothetical protein